MPVINGIAKFLAWLCFLAAAFGIQISVAEDTSSADGMEEAVQLMEDMAAAKYDLMDLWIRCELDVGCVCEKKIEAYKTTTNFVLRVLLEKEHANDPKHCQQIQNQMKACRLPMVTEVNKAVIVCYTLIQQGTFMNDKVLFEEGTLCLAEKLQPFLEDNPYALYVFVDYLATHTDKYPGLYNTYLKRLQNFKDSDAYQNFEQCRQGLIF